MNSTFLGGQLSVYVTLCDQPYYYYFWNVNKKKKKTSQHVTTKSKYNVKTVQTTSFLWESENKKFYPFWLLFSSSFFTWCRRKRDFITSKKIMKKKIKKKKQMKVKKKKQSESRSAIESKRFLNSRGGKWIAFDFHLFFVQNKIESSQI